MSNGYFYGGTVEFKNAMSVIFVCALTMAVVTIQVPRANHNSLDF
jgi:ammonia channel protein AmtB